MDRTSFTFLQTNLSSCCCLLVVFLLLLPANGTGFEVTDDVKRQITHSSDDVKQIAEFILKGAGRHETYSRLAYLGDTFGSRQAGSDALGLAIDYIVGEMTKEGFTNVHKEPVKVPIWVRGNEYATMIRPHVRRLSILGLGSSVGTNGSVMEADVLVVDSFDELDATSTDKVAGKIVVFNQPWKGYEVSAMYRVYGASKAAPKGAVAVLVRSATGYSINSPHTGLQEYAPDVKKIPAACITVEDAQMMRRMQDRGQQIRVKLYMEAKNLPDGTLYNVVAEIPGSQFPNETVIFGGHIDSWDVGTGSLDDGGGVMIAWQALSVIKKPGLRPRRTIRVVLWTGEELGYVGGTAYYEAHKTEAVRVSLIMESDLGAFKPSGIGFSGSKRALAIMEQVMALLAAYNTTDVKYGAGGSSDTGKWMGAGVPGVELQRHDKLEVDDKYFNFHHSNGDTMTVLDPDDMDMCTVVWATVAYVVANLDEMLPRKDDDSTSGSSVANQIHSNDVPAAAAVDERRDKMVFVAYDAVPSSRSTAAAKQFKSSSINQIMKMASDTGRNRIRI